MSSTSVSAVYIHVIDDVISNVRDEFIKSGSGENVLAELQALWEMKMMQCGAISGTIDRQALAKPGGPITSVHDLNVPYEGPIEEYETPTAEMLFPPTPLQTPAPPTPLPPTPLPGMVDHSNYNIPTGPSEYGTPINEIRNGLDLKSGRPSPYMHPPSPWMSQRPLGVDVNVAYVEGREESDRGSSQHSLTQDFFAMPSGKRKREDYTSRMASGGYIPQQDGSADTKLEFVLTKRNPLVNARGQVATGEPKVKQAARAARAARVIPQQDGVHDDYDDLFHFQGVRTEEYSTPADQVELQAPTPGVGTPKPSKSEDAEDDEPPLNEDDDDEEDLEDLDQGEEEPTAQDLVLAQFEKVTRTKSRWKCTLKDGIMRLNNREILFNKANGEFDF